jgi:hypothetical protein
VSTAEGLFVRVAAMGRGHAHLVIQASARSSPSLRGELDALTRRLASRIPEDARSPGSVSLRFGGTVRTLPAPRILFPRARFARPLFARSAG